METEEQYERRLQRENFLEAKTIVRGREVEFAASVAQSLQYSVFANAGAIVTLIGFIGTAGKNLADPRLLMLVFLPFVLGLVCCGRAIWFHVERNQRNFRESISSILIAARERDIDLFNDQCNDNDQLSASTKKWLEGAFVCFILGLVAALFVFPFLTWRP